MTMMYYSRLSKWGTLIKSHKTLEHVVAGWISSKNNNKDTRYVFVIK